jgi:hypothetical protein
VTISPCNFPILPAPINPSFISPPIIVARYLISKFGCHLNINFYLYFTENSSISSFLTIARADI